MAHERNCILCGAEYCYCPKCSAYDKYPRWMISFDKQECHDIFDAVCKYNFNKISASEAKTILNKYPDADYSKYSTVTQNAIKNIEKAVKPKRIRAKTSPKEANKNIEVIDNE